MGVRSLLSIFVLLSDSVLHLCKFWQSDAVPNVGVILASASRQRAQPRRQSPFSSVSVEQADYPDGHVQSVEFARFVTAYGTGMEVLVDVTPYTPLIRAAMDAHKNIDIYTFIDTWVGNGTGSSVIYMNNVTGVCTSLTTSDGNGWSVSAEFLFWPKPSADTKPYSSVTLAAGAFGSDYRIGEISVHEAEMASGSKYLKLDEAADFRNVVDAAVYECEDGSDSLVNEAFLGYVATRSGQLAHMEDDKPIEDFTQEMYEYVAYGGLTVLYVNSVVESNKTVFTTYNTDTATLVEGMPVFYNPNDIYSDALIDEEEGTWWNSSLPFKPVGYVFSASNGTALIKVNGSCLPDMTLKQPGLVAPVSENVLDHARSLILSAVTAGKKAALLAAEMESGQADSSAQPVDKDRSTTTRVASLGAQDAVSSADAGIRTIVDAAQPGGRPLLLRTLHSSNDTGVRGVFDTGLAPSVPFGVIDVEALQLLSQPMKRQSLLRVKETPENKENISKAKADSVHQKVCVVATRRNGHVFERDFTLPALQKGDRVLAQLSVTGHGWAQTTEQCGEYCHAVYSLRFNGKGAANVTQFRDDCKDNPIGDGLQKGTWWEARNGWCPGSVEPGLYFDVTDQVSEGDNTVQFDANVWSNQTGRYELFTDYGGFAFGDRASLVVAMSLFVYDSAAVAAVRGQTQAYTAAEQALRSGVSAPSQLHVPQHVEQPLSIVLLQGENAPLSWAWAKRSRATLAEAASFRYRHRSKHHTLRGGAPRQAPDAPAHTDGFNIEGAAPWYTWNSSKYGTPDEKNIGATSTVEIFRERLMQSNSRIVTSTIDHASLPADWGRVALHLRLSEPIVGNLTMDHWDRRASFGMMLPKGNSNSLTLHPVSHPSTKNWWKWTTK